MDNMSVMKAMLFAVPVISRDRQFSRIVDYTIRPGANGAPVYTAGCLDNANVYRSIPFESLACDADLSPLKFGNIEWQGKYPMKDVIDAMRAGTPVTAGTFSYQKIDSVSIVVNQFRSEPHYAVACADCNGNLVVVKAEQIKIDERED